MKYIYDDRRLKFHVFFIVTCVLRLLSLGINIVNYFLNGYGIYNYTIQTSPDDIQSLYEALHGLELVVLVLGLLFLINILRGASKNKSICWEFIIAYAALNIIYSAIILISYARWGILDALSAGLFTGPIIFFTMTIIYYLRRKPLFFPEMMKEVYPDPISGMVNCRYCKKTIPSDSAYCEWCGRKIGYEIFTQNRELDDSEAIVKWNTEDNKKKRNEKKRARIIVIVLSGIILIVLGLGFIVYYCIDDYFFNWNSNKPEMGSETIASEIAEEPILDLWEELEKSVDRNGTKTNDEHVVSFSTDDITIYVKHDEATKEIIWEEEKIYFDEDLNHITMRFSLYTSKGKSLYSYKFETRIKYYLGDEFKVVMEGSINPEIYNKNKTLPVAKFETTNGYKFDIETERVLKNTCQSGMEDILLFMDTYLKGLSSQFGAKDLGFTIE